MTCDELRPEYGAFSLGVADDPEYGEIQEHLLRQCPACTSGVRSALSAVARMSGAVPLVEPPKRLRARIVAMISPAAPRRGFLVWFPWTVSAALALVLISVALPGRFRKPMTKASTASAHFDEALAILSDPVTKDVAFGEPAARGRFFVSPTRGVVFIGTQMPRLDAARTFELWVIPAGGKPLPAGTFNANADATAIYVRPGPMESAAALAVSVEPAGGAQSPTTTPIIVSKL